MSSLLGKGDWLTNPFVTVPLLGLIALALRFYTKTSQISARARGRPLPPGPRGLPIVGNVLDRPDPATPWLGYRELGRKYGSMVYLRILGQSMLVINDPKVALDLLDKRSAIYSSRPEQAIVSLSGWEWMFAFMPYGQWWRRHRRAFWQYFHPGAMPLYESNQEDGAHHLLVTLLKRPDRVNEAVRYSLGTTICKVVHGLPVAEENDKNITTFVTALKSVELLVAGSTIFELIPVLGKTPTWLPGTAFLRALAGYRKEAHTLRSSPWDQTKEAISAGKAPPSIASAMLENISAQSDDPDVVAEEEGIAMSVAAISYSAGLDTQYAQLQSLFIALSLHTEVQKKAQAELDGVVGPNRLPTFSDRQSLPYVNAVVRELYRWHTGTPLGVAHQSTADDEYNGYFIPADTTVLVNVWSILHDTKYYEQPMEFIPERFLKDGQMDPDVMDPRAILFGWGRRICPGRHFTDTTMFIFVASVLHCYDVTLPLDKNGNPIRTEPQPTAGLVSYVDRSKCTIKPRSASAEALVRSLRN